MKITITNFWCNAERIEKLLSFKFIVRYKTSALFEVRITNANCTIHCGMLPFDENEIDDDGYTISTSPMISSYFLRGPINSTWIEFRSDYEWRFEAFYEIVKCEN